MEAAPTLAGRADPMPAAALGMWLFVAGEAMFFAGLLSAYLVLQSTVGERELFVRSARVVSLPLTIVAIAVLAASAVVVWKRPKPWPIGGLALAFLAIQATSCALLLTHRTIVTSAYVFDGRVGLDLAFSGRRAPLPATLDLAGLMPGDLAGAAVTNKSAPDPADGTDVRADVGYGPSRNNYFACYFLVTAAHALHMIGGLFALAWLAIRTRRRTATAVQVRVVALYWQFVNGVGILSLILLAMG